MRAVLKLEPISKTVRDVVFLCGGLAKAEKYFGKYLSQFYCAELHGKYKKIIKYRKSYKNINHDGSKGIEVFYTLNENTVYEIKTFDSNYFCKIENGKYIKWQKEKK